MQSLTALRPSIALLMLFTVADSFAQTATAPSAAKPSQSPMIGLPESDEGLTDAGPIRRGDWFRSIWNDRRQMFARRSQQDQGAVVFFGDSITQGWGDDLRGAFHDAKVANRGISGDTTRGMLVRLDEDVLTLDPSGVVMLMHGRNK